MLSFENTKVAFSSKSNAELNRSYFLFQIISNPVVVSLGKVMTEMALFLKLPIKPLIKATIFKQFCGGEDIGECSKTIAALGHFHIGTILDYSVEGKESEADFDATEQEILATIAMAKGNEKIPFCVFKLSGIGSTKLLEAISINSELSAFDINNFEKIKTRVNAICKAAFDANVPVFIDAEETWIQPGIDDLANTMMEMYNKEKAIVYNTFQLYRKDRLAYLQNCHQEAKQKKYNLGIKLVRGAYMEKERKRASEFRYSSPIHDNKEATDRDYDEAVAYCIRNLNEIAFCAGTHNESSSWKLQNQMNEAKISSDDKRIFFSQLLGMSDHISYNLSNEGFNVAKYVPYGPIEEVLPYLIRRAEENTSVKGQTGRELGLIVKEKERRKKEPSVLSRK